MGIASCYIRIGIFDMAETLIMASSIGAPCNPTKLSNTFKSLKNVKIGSQTISKYLNYLSESFLLNRAVRYDVKGKKYINTLSKYYFTDIGLRNAILDMRQQEETHIMENIIYNELIVRGYSVDVGMVEIKKPDKDGKWTTFFKLLKVFDNFVGLHGAPIDDAIMRSNSRISFSFLILCLSIISAK